MKKREIHFGASGISLILVLFGIVAMLLLAVLSLSAAQASLRLSQRVLSSEESYADAVSKEAEVLAGLDAALSSGEAANTAAANAGFSAKGDGTYGIAIPCGETQVLAVTVKIEGTTVSAVTEKTQTTEEVTYDTSLPVLKKSAE